MVLNANNSFMHVKAILMSTHLGQSLDEITLIALAQSQEKPYRVVNDALSALNEINPQTALEVILSLNIRESDDLIQGVTNIYTDYSITEHITFIIYNYKQIMAQN